ncbi:unnamed protein product [Trichogramma brassicae]|uniref:Uncharacterized protein n=1 Tax=Trichogramma brassicae TaxID=86971 RepID=A0A6H5I1A9_9HYME|nr:unnamed protein product [Trichogramma brassicae]
MPSTSRRRRHDQQDEATMTTFEINAKRARILEWNQEVLAAARQISMDEVKQPRLAALAELPSMVEQQREATLMPWRIPESPPSTITISDDYSTRVFKVKEEPSSEPSSVSAAVDAVNAPRPRRVEQPRPSSSPGESDNQSNTAAYFYRAYTYGPQKKKGEYSSFAHTRIVGGAASQDSVYKLINALRGRMYSRNTDALFQRVDSFARAHQTRRQRENSYARERKADRPTRKRDEIIFLRAGKLCLFSRLCAIYGSRRRRRRCLYLSMRTYARQNDSGLDARRRRVARQFSKAAPKRKMRKINGMPRRMARAKLMSVYKAWVLKTDFRCCSPRVARDFYTSELWTLNGACRYASGALTRYSVALIHGTRCASGLGRAARRVFLSARVKRGARARSFTDTNTLIVGFILRSLGGYRAGRDFVVVQHAHDTPPSGGAKKQRAITSRGAAARRHTLESDFAATQRLDDDDDERRIALCIDRSNMFCHLSFSVSRVRRAPAKIDNTTILRIHLIRI